MIWHVISLTKTLLVLISITVLLSNTGNAQISASDCRTDRNWVNYEKKGFKTEALMYSECVRQGFPLVGRFHESVIREMYIFNNKVIKLHPSMADTWFKLDWFSEGCLSRVFFDSICLRNAELFKSPYGYLDKCPLPRLHEPSHDDLTQLALDVGLGVRWGLCTSYSNRIIANPVRIGPSVVERLYFNKDERDYVVSNELVVDGLKVKFIDFRKLLVVGDLVIQEVDSNYFDLRDVVVLGDLIIKQSNIEDIGLEGVWVQKNVLVLSNTHETVRLDTVKVGGILEWSGNTSRQGEYNLYDIKGIDIAVRPMVENNRTSGSSKKNRERYMKFLNKLKESNEHTKALRQRN